MYRRWTGRGRIRLGGGTAGVTRTYKTVEGRAVNPPVIRSNITTSIGPPRVALEPLTVVGDAPPAVFASRLVPTATSSRPPGVTHRPRPPPPPSLSPSPPHLWHPWRGSRAAAAADAPARTAAGRPP